jgi:uncharacterized cupin superfamily protein
MPKHIVNVADIELVPRPAEQQPPGASAELFGLRTGSIGALIGAQKLGYNVTVLPPGKRAYPFHSHRVNEEMFFILEGTGEVRIGNETHPLRAGDIVACPPGGPEAAHQIINSGTAELRYLSVSTRLLPEVCEYPDSAKLGFYADFSAADGPPQLFRHLAREGYSLDYWDGE